MTDAFRLDDHVAIITGGTKGIGRAIAELFRDQGATVVVCGRNDHNGREFSEATGIPFLRADVTDEEDVRSLVERTCQDYGDVSVLVNNAGPTDLLHARNVDGPIGQVRPADWRRMLDQTLTTAYLATHYALEPMARRGGGSIVNISSIAAAQGMPGFDGYAAGKAAVEGLTRAVACGYGHLGIRCNAVRVGTIAVDHERGRARPAQAPPKIRKDFAADDWRQAAPPAAGDPRDVAHAVRYLASPAAAYVTGVTLPVDGGMTCRSLMPWQTLRPEMEPGGA